MAGNEAGPFLDQLEALDQNYPGIRSSRSGCLSVCQFQMISCVINITLALILTQS